MISEFIALTVGVGASPVAEEVGVAVEDDCFVGLNGRLILLVIGFLWPVWKVPRTQLSLELCLVA